VRHGPSVGRRDAIACTVITQVPISRTDTSPTATAPIEMRPLSPTEKAALAKTLSQTVTNPSNAQFKWLPVAANGGGRIGYCGLVNVKKRQMEQYDEYDERCCSGCSVRAARMRTPVCFCEFPDCLEPWWVSPILMDNTSLFEVGDYKWAWEIDSKTLESLTGR
jgi:hypothetical protein